jgi:hypothetical protein
MCVKLAQEIPFSIFLRETADYLQVQDNPYFESDKLSTGNGSPKLE